MSILKGGFFTVTYSFTFIDNQVYDGSGNIASNANWSRSSKIQVINNSLILNQLNSFHVLHVWDTSNNYIGFYRNTETLESGDLTTSIGDLPVNETNLNNFIQTNNIGYFATQASKSRNISFALHSTTEFFYEDVSAIQDIYYGQTLVPRAYLGDILVFGSQPFGAYELIADVNVTTNTTQIDFDNLNITKDDELRLVWTNKPATQTFRENSIFVNNNNTQTNYWTQFLGGFGTGIAANRLNRNFFAFSRLNGSNNGFCDIKVSNNDRFVVQSQFTYNSGSSSSELIEQYATNTVSTFAVSTITKLSILSSVSNGFANGARLQLYKVVR